MEYDSMMPVYLQVAAAVKHDIVTGKRRLGEKLPSVRDLAVEYTINPNTVGRVYRELEQDGLCFTRRGMGTFVTEDSRRLEQLRREMAQELLDSFLSGMAKLGIPGRDAARMAAEQAERAERQKTEQEEKEHNAGM